MISILIGILGLASYDDLATKVWWGGVFIGGVIGSFFGNDSINWH